LTGATGLPEKACEGGIPGLSGGGSMKAKFTVGQVVMIEVEADGSSYPVKLDHRTRIGTKHSSPAWMDTLGNVEFEEEMRPLNAREKGKP
jgi:hypothetical protein